ncbi:mechanosensitive ion channel [Actinocatenispora rupis]|uniref:Mechanosensitive ion channel protein MscS n=1 Tax=Actinocatenispora rupis TaxID=519421 RepID=A0A8J3J841_9ACTN|nr:mechanosensitive ion channel protein MscS [Actinocatenispora rupis]
MQVLSDGAMTMLHPVLAGPVFDVNLTGKPACASDPESFCQTVWNWTGQNNSLGWLASSSEWLLVKPFRIILILVVALVLRWVAHRMIRRMTRTREGSGTPAVLRPLKERVNNSLRENGVLSERRSQRAATIGSVLRNVFSIVIFSIAVMMILSELGLDLAPLLASAGIVGVALGFGAQSLVKDVISGMFMLLEDQYGVGDVIDVGETTGTVEAVGLRITTVRDATGVLWYIRNGEVVRIGNHSQSWAMVTIDVPIGFGASVEDATAALDAAVEGMDSDEAWAGEFIDPPTVLGVQQLTVDGAVLRVQAKTSSDGQWKVARELRRRITAELERAGLASRFDPRRAYPAAPGTTDA